MSGVSSGLVVLLCPITLGHTRISQDLGRKRCSTTKNGHSVIIFVPFCRVYLCEQEYITFINKFFFMSCCLNLVLGSCTWQLLGSSFLMRLYLRRIISSLTGHLPPKVPVK